MSEFKCFNCDDEEGWLGDQKYPSLFCRNHVIQERYELIFPSLTKPDMSKSWIENTSHSTTFVYMSIEDLGDCDLEFNLLSAIPDIGRRKNFATWLEHEINTDEGALWELAFGTERYSTDSLMPIADWAMKNGICPGQWFIVKLVPNYKDYYDSWSGGYECDFECEATIISKEKISPQEHIKRWEEFFMTTLLQDGLPRVNEIVTNGISILTGDFNKG